MKNIFIIGSRGYEKDYGGWETFVKRLADNYDKTKANIYVSEITFNKRELEYKKNNIICNPIYTRKVKGATMMIYSIKTLYYYLSYIKANNLKNCIFLILGLKMGPFLKILNRQIKDLNIKVFVNPDGLEWKRSKWSYPIKNFFLYEEKVMLNYCDGIICDNEGIKEYLENTYKKNKIPKYFIAYGTDEIDLTNIDEDKILKEFNLKKDNYLLIVGRCVPENNLELIIKEFMKSSIKKDLVIISNINSDKYYEKLKIITNLENDSRIIVIPGIYDKEKLCVIRKNAFLYLHGHSVGGTNPSLLEAMNYTDLNILYDVDFNRNVGGNTCLYFNSNKNNLKKLLDNIEVLEKNKKLGVLARKRVKEHYTWDFIVKKYEDVFK